MKYEGATHRLCAGVDANLANGGEGPGGRAPDIERTGGADVGPVTTRCRRRNKLPVVIRRGVGGRAAVHQVLCAALLDQHGRDVQKVRHFRFFCFSEGGGVGLFWLSSLGMMNDGLGWKKRMREDKERDRKCGERKRKKGKKKKKKEQSTSAYLVRT